MISVVTRLHMLLTCEVKGVRCEALQDAGQLRDEVGGVKGGILPCQLPKHALDVGHGA